MTSSKPIARWPLVALLALLVLLPVAGLGIAADRAASRSVHERVADGQQAIGRALAEAADRDVATLEERTSIIVNRQGFAEAVASGDATQLVSVLSRLEQERLHYRRLAVVLADGRVIARAPHDLGPVGGAGSSDRIGDAEVRVSQARSLVTLGFDVPEPAPSGSRLLVEIDLGDALAGVEKARIGAGGRATLVRSDGSVLLSGDPALRGEVLARLERDIDRLGSRSQSTSDEVHVDGDGDPSALTRLGTGWYLAISQPRSEAFAPVADLRRTILVASLVTLLAGGIAALWVASVVRRTQWRLVASERRAGQITNAAHQAFVSMDRSGVVTGWNPAAEQAFGWSARQAVGKPIRDLLIPERYHDRYERWLRQLVARSAPWDLDASIEILVSHQDGHELPVEVTVSELDTGDEVEYFAFLRDITVRRELERERTEASNRLQQANEELRVAGELKSDFLAMASHELRTPLTSISGFAKTMLSMWDVLPDDSKRDYIGIIDGQADRLGRLVTDLLMLSRIERGRVHVETAPVHARVAIEQALRDLGASHVDVDCPPDVVVLADEDHLQQILLNLVSNALKYGKPPIGVAVEVKQHNAAWVDVTVRDSGDGVPDAFVPHLFERFSQAPEHVPGHRTGAGLGLSIVAGLAEAQGGTVRYERVEQGGASFVVRLPVSR